MQAVSITATVGDQTTDATPKNVVLFAMNESSGAEGRLQVICRRPSDGASKAWSFSALMRRNGSGTPESLGNAGVTPFGAALDLTALLTCTIAFFVSGSDVGITVTGLAGTPLSWGLFFDGVQIIDNA